MIGLSTLNGGDNLVSLFADQRDVPGDPTAYRSAVDAWLELTRRHADRARPIWGAIALDAEGPTTAYERAAGANPRHALLQGMARGFSWVTILGGPLTGRVGGIRSLRDAHVFFEVSEVASGGAWLRATELPHEYSLPHWRQVHIALREVLPPVELWGPALPHYGRRLQLVTDLDDLEM